MRNTRRSRALSLVFARATALLVLVPALAAGLAVAATSGAGSGAVAGAATAHGAHGATAHNSTADSATSAYGSGWLMAADPTGGYWTVTAAGAVTPHGSASSFGSPAASGVTLSRPVVGMAATPDGRGYWLVATDGGIFNYGDATFYGSTGAIHLNRSIVGMAATPDGRGYWLVASDGGIFSYGDATFYGSTGAIHLNKDIVGMAATTDGRGYWLVASDGGIFSYGDASFHGSTGAIRLNQPIIGMAPTPDGAGYWLVAFDGGVFTFGDAGYWGSTASSGVFALGLIVQPPALGYAVITATGAEDFFGPSSQSPSISQNPPSTTSTTSPPSRSTTSTTRVHTTTTTAPPTTTTAPPSAPVSTGALEEGVYVDPASPSGVRSFATKTGTSPSIAADYLPGSSGWAGMDGAGGSLNWLLQPFSASGYTLELGVPMIPTSNGSPVGTLAQGASGAFNAYYVTLAQALVSGGESTAYLRLGWEFDGSWMPWAATTASSEASFAAYFQQIVTAMRSVAGANFHFVWNPDAGAFTQAGYSVAAAYPGDAYVDVIGLDAYDQSWATPQTPANAWTSTMLPTLTAARQFAAAHGKPLAFPEWGVAIRSDGHGLGDDPYFINQFVAWMQNRSNGVAYETYFDDNSGGVNSLITGGSFPNSLAAFTAGLG